MKRLQKTIEQMNKFGRNACEEAWNAVGEATGINDAIDSWAKSERVLDEAFRGLNDFFESGKNNGNDPQNKVSPETLALLDMNLIAYIVDKHFSTLKINGAAFGVDLNGSSVGGTNDEAKQAAVELIMSLSGSIIQQTKTGADCDAAKAAGNKCSHPDAVDPSISLLTLLNGADGAFGQTMQRCTGSGTDIQDKCMTVEPGALADETENGLFNYYKELINGSGTQAGILQIIREKQTGSLREDQKAFMKLSAFPFVKVAATFKENVSDEIGELLALRIARDHITQLGNQVRVTLSNAIIASKLDEKKIIPHEDVELLFKNFNTQFEHFNDHVATKRNELIDNTQHMYTAYQLVNLSKAGGI